MILVDYNQVMLASLFAGIGNHTNMEVDENLLRHMFLNSIRFNRKKFYNLNLIFVIYLSKSFVVVIYRN